MGLEVSTMKLWHWGFIITLPHSQICMPHTPAQRSACIHTHTAGFKHVLVVQSWWENYTFAFHSACRIHVRFFLCWKGFLFGCLSNCPSVCLKETASLLGQSSLFSYSPYTRCHSLQPTEVWETRWKSSYLLSHLSLSSFKQDILLHCHVWWASEKTPQWHKWEW